jgi:hypothetical protein
MATQERRRDLGFIAPRDRPFGRALRWLYLLAPIVTAAMVVAAIAWRGQAIATSGPVSPAHAGFGDACGRCHAAAGRVLRARDERRASLAMNEDCLACHGRTIGHAPATLTATHHERVPGDGLACATCHREHEGRPLAMVDDAPCVRCHADLAAVEREPGVAAKIGSFAGHPEFRRFAPSAADAAGEDDEGVLRFNHRRHLEGRVAGPGGRPVTLACRDCHRPEGEVLPWPYGRDPGASAPAAAPSLPRGASMAPIAYASHCAGCHPLAVQGRALRGDDAVPRDEVPHTRPAAVRTYLRGQLAARGAGADELPGLEHGLFRVEGQGCRKCHELRQGSLDETDLPVVVPPALPARFLPRARFDHAKHTAAALGEGGGLDCLACHGRALESTRTKDVLVPSIAACRRCHGPKGERGPASTFASGGVVARCTTCHTYHVPPPEAQGPGRAGEDGDHGLLPSLVAAGRHETREGLRKGTPLWTMSAFFDLPGKVWGRPDVAPGTEAFRREVFRRYGLFSPDYPNDGLPLGLLRTDQPRHGEPGVTLTCELCHSSSLFGSLVLGQPNPFSSMEQLWVDLSRASGERESDPLYYKNPPDNTMVNGADQLGLLGLVARNADLSPDVATALRIAHGLASDLQAEFDAIAYVKTPAWYTYATKKSGAHGMYADGGHPKNGNFAAFTYMVSFYGLDGQDLVEALAAWQRSGPSFLSSLTPPRYPFPVDAARARRGRRLYDDRCARCHGTYAEGDPSPDRLTFPGIVTPLDDVKTDPKRAHFPRKFGERAKAVLKMDYELTGGYAAPPLTAIWARAPYLHNGAVPTLAELLDPPSRRARWALTADPDRAEDYDKDRVGWRVTEPASGDHRVYDPTRIDGLGNEGHLYGADLSPDDRADLLEFLKSL